MTNFYVERCAPKLRYYGDVIMVVFKMRDSIPSARYSPFVMYCVNGKPRSSLLIESRTSNVRRRRARASPETSTCEVPNDV